MFLWAQILRIFSAFFEVLADKESDRKKIFLYNGIYNFFCAIQYFMLNAITGGICSLLAIIRNVLFNYCKKKYLYFLLPLYFIILILLNYKSIDSLLAFVPLFLVIVYSTALFIGNIYGIKYTVIVAVFLEIIYDFYYEAYVGMIVCAIDIVFVIISLVKLKKKEAIK